MPKRADGVEYAIPDEHARRHGRIIATFGQVEFTFETAIWAVAGLDQHDGRIFTAPLKLRAKLNTLAGIRPPWLEEFLPHPHRGANGGRAQRGDKEQIR